MKTLSPSGIELELISLASFEIDTTSKQNPNFLLEQMLQTFFEAIDSNSETDFVQALLNNFLQNHNDLIIADDELSNLLSDIKNKLQIKFKRLEHLIGANLCMT